MCGCAGLTPLSSLGGLSADLIGLAMGLGYEYATTTAAATTCYIATHPEVLTAAEDVFSGLMPGPSSPSTRYGVGAVLGSNYSDMQQMADDAMNAICP